MLWLIPPLYLVSNWIELMDAIFLEICYPDPPTGNQSDPSSPLSDPSPANIVDNAQQYQTEQQSGMVFETEQETGTDANTSAKLEQETYMNRSQCSRQAGRSEPISVNATRNYKFGIESSNLGRRLNGMSFSFPF
ncbi:hypothetical protein LXL04_011779 [Taraxacum kok-saghyz]